MRDGYSLRVANVMQRLAVTSNHGPAGAANGPMMPLCHDPLAQTDVSQFAQAVVSRLQDELLRQRLGAITQNVVPRKFTWDRSAAALNRPRRNRPA